MGFTLGFTIATSIATELSRLFCCIQYFTIPELFISTAFQFLCMALAIDTIDGRGLSNEACRELLPKNGKIMLNLSFISQ